MALFGKTYNKTNVAERNIIASLLYTLHKQLSFKIQRGDGTNNTVEEYKIPFFYAFGGSEDFMYDRFMKPLFDNESKAETQYEKVPRGVITHTSTSISTQHKTSPFMYGTFVEQTQNGLKSFRAKYKAIPIIMNFECSILVAANLDLYKVSEEIMRLLHKSTQFQVNIDKIPIPAILQIPEDLERKKDVEFSFGDRKNMEINFNFEVFSYIPTFDENSKIFSGKRMQGGITANMNPDNINEIGYNVNANDVTNNNVQNIPKDIDFTPPN